MKNTKFALVATLGFALAFIFSCTVNDDGGGNETSYNYCITANNACLTGPFTASDCNGQLSNSCPDPNGSNPSVSGSSSSVKGGSSSSMGGNTTYSLDGIWESDHGIIISIYGGKAVFTNIDALAAWREVEKKGNIKIGDSYYKNITKTGDLTWSMQVQQYNTPTYELMPFASGTIALNSNGQTFTATASEVHTFTRKTISTLDGIWESDHGIVISIYDGKAVFTNIDALADWREVEKKGNIKIGDLYYKNITKTGDLTWSMQVQQYNTPTYELMPFASGTIALNPNGQTFTATAAEVHIFTRK